MAVSFKAQARAGFHSPGREGGKARRSSGAMVAGLHSQSLNALDTKMAPVEGRLSAAASGPYGVPAYTGNPGFTGVNGAFAGLMVIVEYESDHAPVDAQVKAFHDYCTDLDNNLALWRTINTVDVPALNELLRQNNVKPLTPDSPPGDLACGAVPAGFAAAPVK